MKTVFVFLAALTLGTLSLPSWAAGPPIPPSPPLPPPAHERDFTAAVPATALTALRLDTLVGQVRISTSNSDTVRIRVQAVRYESGRFIFNWTVGPSGQALPADLHLVTRREGGILTVCLASAQASGCKVQPANATSSAAHTNTIVFGPMGSINVGGSQPGWKANWVITLPARLALVLKAGVADTEVTGIAGGLQAKIGVGKLAANLPRGPVNVDLGVGDVSAAIASADYGEVDLTAGVGDVEFDVNGRKNAAGYTHQVTAASQHLSGSGTTAYTIKAGVGHVKLELGEKDILGAGQSAAD